MRSAAAQALVIPASEVEYATACWVPHAGPQEQFVASEVKDVCYGGSRGGAKTAGLILAFARHERRYGRRVAGIIFRKTFDELSEVVKTADEHLVGHLGWTATKSPGYVYTAPSGGTLKLWHLADMADAQKHDGKQYTFIGGDEAGNWDSPEPLDYVMGCLRSPYGIPTVRRLTCMPGGPGHVWVKERYDPEGEVVRPGTIRTVVPFPDSHPEISYESMFIPAHLEDNPAIDPDQYKVSLAMVASEELLDAWLTGNWRNIRGAFFSCWNFDTMTIPLADFVLEPWHTRWISGDWGYDHPSVIYWHRQDENGDVVTYRELKVRKVEPLELGRRISDLNDGEDIRLFAFSPDAFAEKSSPRTVALELGEGLEDCIPQPSRADNDRIGGWRLMSQLLKAGRWKIVREACPELIKTLPHLQKDPDDSEDVQKCSFDDEGDGARYGLKTFLRAARAPREVQVAKAVEQRMVQTYGAMKPVEQMSQAEAKDFYNRIAFVSRREESKVSRRFRRVRRLRP